MCVCTCKTYRCAAEGGQEKSKRLGANSNTVLLHFIPVYVMVIPLWILLRKGNVSDKSRENQNTHLCSVFFFFSKLVLFIWDNVGKCCRAGQATDDNMAHAHCMLDTKGYRHTPRICNTYYCFCSATMVIRTRLNVTLLAPCLSC
jgi:hypothetical protein